jgi:hypothetical protein
MSFASVSARMGQRHAATNYHVGSNFNLEHLTKDSASNTISILEFAKLLHICRPNSQWPPLLWRPAEVWGPSG